ncbi:MAG: hypothetical protein LPK02_07650 [Rhodobacterales bacterium]|nr:hypothetical protein [Rhodobacterales bacterium]
MPSLLENVKVGVCTVTFNAVDLGYTKGGVEVEVSTEKYTVTVDQFGNTPINDYLIGRSIMVTTPLAETTVENLVATMPGATLVTNAGNSKAEVTTGIGTNLIDLAQPLILHPIAAGASLAEDITIPRAATAGNMTFSYQLDSERVFNVQWMGYPDPTTGLLYVMGDPAIVAP